MLPVTPFKLTVMSSFRYTGVTWYSSTFVTVCVGVKQVWYCVLCTEAVHSHKHSLMSSSYSFLDWVLSHWAHFSA